MTTLTRKKLEATRKLNELAIQSADRHSAELQDALRRSRAVTDVAISALKRAGYIKNS